MNLLIDVGNTQTVFSIKDGKGYRSWRLNTHRNEKVETYRAFMRECLREVSMSFDDIDTVLIASVVPQVDRVLREFCEDVLGAIVEFVNYQSDYLDLQICIDQPETVGADRLVNAVYAKENYPLPCVVVDFGTATTFDVVGIDGDYIGGVIAPGVNLSMSALYQAASKLPKIDLKPIKSAIGKNTVDAMTSGVYLGYASMIEGMILRIEKEVGQSVSVVATGGLASLFESEIDRIDTVDSYLTLAGLDMLATRVFIKDKRKAVSNG